MGNGRLPRVDKGGLSTEKNKRADQQGVKRWINVTKLSNELGRQEIATLPIILAMQFPSIVPSYQWQGVEEADFNMQVWRSKTSLVLVREYIRQLSRKSRLDKHSSLLFG